VIIRNPRTPDLRHFHIRRADVFGHHAVFHFIIGIDIVGRWFAGPAQAYKPPLKAAMLLYSIIKDPTSKYYRDE
jgi:hypothetical protein